MQNQKSKIILFAIAAVFLMLFLIRIVLMSIKNPIFWDESYSLLIAQKSIHDILFWSSFDTTPPLYYIGLHFWGNITGFSVFTGRLYAGLLTTLGILIMAWYFWRHHNPRTSVYWLISATSFSFLITAMAVYTRQYGQIIFFISLAIISAEQLCKNWKTSWATLFVLSALGAMYTHNIGLIGALVILIVYAALNPLRHIRLTRFMFLGFIIGLFYLPWLPILKLQINQVSQNFWVPALTLKDIPSSFSSIWFGQPLLTSDATVKSLMTASLITLLIVIWTWSKSKGKQGYMLSRFLWAGLFCWAGIIIFSFQQSIMINRSFTISAIFFFGLFSLLLGQIKNRTLFATVILVALTIQISTILYISTSQKILINDEIIAQWIKNVPYKDQSLIIARNDRVFHQIKYVLPDYPLYYDIQLNQNYNQTRQNVPLGIDPKNYYIGNKSQKPRIIFTVDTSFNEYDLICPAFVNYQLKGEVRTFWIDYMLACQYEAIDSNVNPYLVINEPQSKNGF